MGIAAVHAVLAWLERRRRRREIWRAADRLVWKTLQFIRELQPTELVHRESLTVAC
jgi:hypothetical protein